LTATDALVSWGSATTSAKIVQATPSVLVLQGELPEGPPLPPGAPVQVELADSQRAVQARVAAYGQGGRYLLALGMRAVRGAARVRVDLPATVRGGGLPAPARVRIVDLSSSGARLRGLRLAVGADIELSFVPPGRRDAVTMRNVVVRAMDERGEAEIGVAFCGSTLSFSVDLTQQLAPGRR
jgi:hypothetical protein